MPFVDAHVHLWDLSRLHYPWLTPPFADDGPNGSVEAIARNYLLDDYLADAARWNVVGLVHIDAGADASAAIAETEWLQTMRDARELPSGRSEEHTSELQSLMRISYAVFCLKKKNIQYK